MDGSLTLDSRSVMARRLRRLRQEHWPGSRLTQPELTRALGGDYGTLSVPAISSWGVNNPKIPPAARLEAYATFFATPRSIEGESRQLRWKNALRRSWARSR
jgi:hypothetical protein